MDVNFECRGIGNTVRILLTAVAALLVSAPVSAGSKDDERAALCSGALTADYGATEFSDFSHTQHGHRSVYITARLADGETIRFRCLFRLDTIRTLRGLCTGRSGDRGLGVQMGLGRAISRQTRTGREYTGRDNP